LRRDGRRAAILAAGLIAGGTLGCAHDPAPDRPSARGPRLAPQPGAATQTARAIEPRPRGVAVVALSARTGLPIRGARISLGMRGADRSETDSTGWVIVSRPVSGEGFLEVAADGFGSRELFLEGLGAPSADTVFVKLNPRPGPSVKDAAISFPTIKQPYVAFDPAGTGRLTVIIRDASTGAPIEGAIAELEGLRLGGVTDSSGVAILDRVPVGEVSVRARLIGYVGKRIRFVTITSGRSETIAVTLEPGRHAD